MSLTVGPGGLLPDCSRNAIPLRLAASSTGGPNDGKHSCVPTLQLARQRTMHRNRMFSSCSMQHGAAPGPALSAARRDGQRGASRARRDVRQKACGAFGDAAIWVPGEPGSTPQMSGSACRSCQKSDHGSRDATRFSIVRRLKRPGCSDGFTSSQSSGVDTAAPGCRRTEYGATMV